MMQKLKEEITAAANRELNRANEQFPLFTSKHEGVAVAYEELEESKEALEELEASFAAVQDYTKLYCKNTPEALAGGNPPDDTKDQAAAKEKEIRSKIAALTIQHME